jgi:hypothetical protein
MDNGHKIREDILAAKESEMCTYAQSLNLVSKQAA